MKKIYLLFIVIILNMLNLSRIHGQAAIIFNSRDAMKLINAVRFGNMKRARALIDGGIDVDIKSEEGITPLYYFFLKSNYICFKRMLELGADPNIDPRGRGLYRLINYSMRDYDDRYFKLLLEYDVNLTPDRVNGDYSKSPLHDAMYDWIDIKYLRMLLEHGIDVRYYSRGNFWIENPLTNLFADRDYKKIQLLLEYSADDFINDDKVWNYFIQTLRECVEWKETKALKEQQELIKYIKEKLGYDVNHPFPDGDGYYTDD